MSATKELLTLSRLNRVWLSIISLLYNIVIIIILQSGYIIIINDMIFCCYSLLLMLTVS